MVAAAVIGAAVVGAGATAYAGNKAAGATQSATQAATTVQQQALQQQAQMSQPYRDLGTGSIDQYKSLLGLGPQGSAGIQPTLAATPGYQFQKQQGIDATKAAAGAMGLGLSGNTLQGIDQFSTGLADSTYQQVLGNNLNAVQLGQAAAAGQAANIGNAAANTGNLIMNQGNVNAGIYANEAAGLAKIAGGAANQYTTLNTLKNLNNPGFNSPDVAYPDSGGGPG